MTDPTSYSPGHTHWDLPTLLSGVLTADLLWYRVTGLVVLGNLVALSGQSAIVAQVSLVVRLGDALLPVLEDILTVLPDDLLTVGLVDLVALLLVASLLDGVVLHTTPHLLLVLPVAAVVVTVAQDGAHGAQDNLNMQHQTQRLGWAGQDLLTRTRTADLTIITAAGRLLSRTDLANSHSSNIYTENSQH